MSAIPIPNRQPSLFDPRTDGKKPQLSSGSVVAIVSKSKGVRTLSVESRNSSLKRAELRHSNDGFEVNPYRLRNESGLESPYFVQTLLRYDPNAKESYIVLQSRVYPTYSCSALLREPRQLKPYHYEQITIVSDAPEVPHLCLSVHPRVALLRPSESLALLLHVYGSMSISQASRGSGLTEASVRSSAAALTRKGVIKPVGRGTFIDIGDGVELRKFLQPQPSVKSDWLTAFFSGSAVELMKGRAVKNR